MSWYRRFCTISRCKRRTIASLIKGLNQILKLEQFTSKSQRLIKDMELTIYLDKEYHELLDELPDNILLKDINEFFI